MPRRSSGGTSRGGSFGRAPLSKPPKPVTPAPPPAPVKIASGPLMGGLGATVAEGMAFGTGSAIAHRAVDAMMGPRVVQHEPVKVTAASSPSSAHAGLSSDICINQSKAFQDCLNSFGSEVSKCQFYMDMLQECRRNSSTGLVA